MDLLFRQSGLGDVTYTRI